MVDVHVEGLGVETGDSITAGEASAEVADAVVDAGASIRNIVSDTAEDIANTLATLIRDKPLVAVGVAAGLAYVLGRLKS